MTRHLRKSILAFALILVLGATTATGASAAKLTTQTGTYPAQVRGIQVNENVLSNGIRSVTCKSALLLGTLSAAAESLTLNAVSYGECTANGGIPATVTMNGCDYKLVVTSVAAPNSVEHAVIECLAGKTIVISIYVKPGGALLCELTVGPQTITGLSGVNGGSGTSSRVDLTVASKNVNIKRAFGTPANCGVTEQTAGTYNGKINFPALDNASQPVGLLVD